MPVLLSHDTLESANALYLAHLTGCGLSGLLPEEPPPSCDWREVYRLAGWNSVTGLTWHSVRRLKSLPDSLRKSWERSAEATWLRRVQYDLERQQIVNALLERGVSVAPLNGASLERLYPSPDMRSMSDNDLLYGYVVQDTDGHWCAAGDESEVGELMEQARLQVDEVMEHFGYRCDYRGELCTTNDTRYIKPPYLCFEMHHALVGNKPTDNIDLGNPWPMFESIPGVTFGAPGHLLRIRQDAEYLYCIDHAYKHSGVGLRFLADLWLMRAGLDRVMNEGSLRKLLSDFDLLRYEGDMWRIANGVFGAYLLSDDDATKLARMIEGGTFGSGGDGVIHDINRLRARGKRHPRLAFLSEVLSPERGQPTEGLKRISQSRVLRPIFPCIKALWLIDKSVRCPRVMLEKIQAFIQGGQS